ncbi:uncharacterized protein B0H18DRAFT_518100 [Fomitopsis serialis]|uniref:uncharacterized protein n=1 Tax=Fomitopsis serialis TaxID=139415 RepID=UPI0020078104|nr:uncharacterized protein B0H18DRAFT_518100 [Neoantrodia serialis]KAH9922381.1 hypothetical protein B0H18DRAFT_518100 [Neoantrodia serialis]
MSERACRPPSHPPTRLLAFTMHVRWPCLRAGHLPTVLAVVVRVVLHDDAPAHLFTLPPSQLHSSGTCARCPLTGPPDDPLIRQIACLPAHPSAGSPTCSSTRPSARARGPPVGCICMRGIRPAHSWSARVSTASRSLAHAASTRVVPRLCARRHTHPLVYPPARAAPQS